MGMDVIDKTPRQGGRMKGIQKKRTLDEFNQLEKK
jgi:hypothetical protein